jgi:hypothetical protein
VKSFVNQLLLIWTGLDRVFTTQIPCSITTLVVSTFCSRLRTNLTCCFAREKASLPESFVVLQQFVKALF